MEKETDRFKAVDGIGEEFTVIEYREVREQRDLEGKISTTYGLPRLALDDGSAVNSSPLPSAATINNVRCYLNNGHIGI